MAREIIFDTRTRAGAPRSALLIETSAMGGKFTFLVPLLGGWRLCGVPQRASHEAEVFDPNCCEGTPEDALRCAFTGSAIDDDLGG